MANLEVIALDTATPQLKAPQAGDGYAMPRPVTVTEVVGSTALTLTGATQTTAVPVLNATQTWNNAAITFTGLKFNATDTASNAASLLMDLQVGGTSLFSVNKSGDIQLWSNPRNITWGNISGVATLNFAGNRGNTPVMRLGGATNGIELANTSIGWANNSAYTTIDLTLYRDAADTLAQRRSTNAQTFRVYKSYTDASNYSRLAINNNQIASEVLGTGSLAITADTPLLNLAQTWNNAAVTFTGAKINVTDTASNAASLLLDLQVGGTSLFSVNKAGAVVGKTAFCSGASNPDIQFGSRTTVTHASAYNAISSEYTNSSISFFVNSTTRSYMMRSLEFILSATGNISWSDGNADSATRDLKLFRDAANTLAQRNGTNAQTFRVYNTYTSGTSYERIGLTWTSNVAYLAPEKGSGGGSDRLLVVSTGATTVAGLPSAATAGTGARSFVTDATATTFLSTVAGGGANKVPVVSDGTNWLIG